jgi:hypothetical protein
LLPDAVRLYVPTPFTCTVTWPGAHPFESLKSTENVNPVDVVPEPGLTFPFEREIVLPLHEAAATKDGPGRRTISAARNVPRTYLAIANASR